MFFNSPNLGKQIRYFMAWSAVSGGFLYSLEMVGLVLLGAIIGGETKALHAVNNLPIGGFPKEYVLLAIYSAKLVSGYFCLAISLKLIKRIIVDLTGELATKHLLFSEKSSSESGSLSNMIRNCLTITTYMDGNYLRQLGIVIQEIVLLTIIVLFLSYMYGAKLLAIVLPVVAIFFIIKKALGSALLQLGQEVVAANGSIVKCITEQHRMRKELNIWVAVPDAVGKIRGGMRQMLTANFRSELLLNQIRPAIETVAVFVFVGLVLGGALSAADLMLIGMFMLRAMPSIIRIQFGLTSLISSSAAREELQRVLLWR